MCVAMCVEYILVSFHHLIVIMILFFNFKNELIQWISWIFFWRQNRIFTSCNHENEVNQKTMPSIPVSVLSYCRTANFSIGKNDKLLKEFNCLRWKPDYLTQFVEFFRNHVWAKGSSCDASNFFLKSVDCGTFITFFL